MRKSSYYNRILINVNDLLFIRVTSIIFGTDHVGKFCLRYLNECVVIKQRTFDICYLCKCDTFYYYLQP